MDKLQGCRHEMHTWGRRNRVEFDAAKEPFVILHPTSDVDDDFKLLGLIFDHKLRMDSEIEVILKTAYRYFQRLS